MSDNVFDLDDDSVCIHPAVYWRGGLPTCVICEQTIDATPGAPS